jgi:hypothetical protein
MTWSPEHNKARWGHPAERFWRSVDRTGRCWLWTGTLTPTGYARLRWNGRAQMAHRVSLAIAGIEVPADREVDHLCRTRNCVNPEHLEVVDHAVNVRRARPTKPVCGHEYDLVLSSGKRVCGDCYRRYYRDRARRRRMAAKRP